MAETTWKQAVYDIADAYREAEGTEDKISIANLKEKVREGSSKVTLDGEKVKELAMTSYQGDNPLTIGADGAVFDPNVLLKAGLTILNGVSGEDLTDPIALLSEAVAENLRLAKSKYAENNGAGAYVWKKLTAEGGDFVDYVISDASDAYPDGGTQDGYWYELVTDVASLKNFFGALGYTKVTVETVTPSSDISEGTTLSHNHGQIPKYILIFSEKNISTAQYMQFVGMSTSPVGAAMGMTDTGTIYSNSNRPAFTSTTFKTYGVLKGGAKHTIVCLSV